MNNAVTTLPRLSHKQQNYYFHRVEGKEPSQAYLAAYDADPKSLYTRQAAYKVEHNPKVQMHLDHYRETVGRIICSRESHLHRLDLLGREAQGKGETGSAIRAEELRGKAVGHYNHTKHVQTQHMDLAELLKAIDGQSRGIQLIEGECEEAK